MKKLIKDILYAAHKCGVCSDWGDIICDEVLELLKQDCISDINEEKLDKLALERYPIRSEIVKNGLTFVEVDPNGTRRECFKEGCKEILKGL